MDSAKTSRDPGADIEQPVAWRAVPENVDVRAQGTCVGTLYDLLGSRSEDIFHGIVVKLGSGRQVFVPSDYVSALTVSRVDVELSASEVEALPGYVEERNFDLGIVGFRKRLGWKEEKDR